MRNASFCLAALREIFLPSQKWHSTRWKVSTITGRTRLRQRSGAPPRNNMHDNTDQPHWHEPKAGENAGFGKFTRKPMPYDSFMEAEGIPVYRGIGVRRVQDLPMKPWHRLGGRGSSIQLSGTEGVWGSCYIQGPCAG